MGGKPRGMMDLPVMPPVKPMLAKLARTLPVGDDLIYEPKWDGFRCIVFRDGDDLELGSRNERPLTRYFPELAEALKAQLPQQCVLDGEIVIATPGGLDFESLLQRIHPAESRIQKLAEETPSSFVAFDLLSVGDDDLRESPFSARRSALEAVLAGARSPVHLTPATDDPSVATVWFDRFEGAGLDGVVAKNVDLPYRENERIMLKVKHERTADCVVAGFRWHKTGPIVGSLLLGVYDEAGTLHHVGVAASFTVARRKELVEELAPYRENALEDHPWGGWLEAVAGANLGGGRMPGGQSRWNAGRDQSWEPLRPELVVEVAFDHLQGDRFRHATQFRRWRTDRDPRSCTYDQFEVPVPEELAAVFGA
ncbi:MAG TPA: ATP-dependent DNA ligase [Acidimicrobiales bacterium]|nr:ATP-dependent DNA ligase [Acidimicrobiales bacterium]